MPGTTGEIAAIDPRAREAATTLPVYGQLPFVPERASGCDIITNDGRRILDLYGGHAVAALGYGHPRLTAAISEQSAKLLFQSNAVALEVRAQAAEKLVGIAPDELKRVFFVNSGAEANENALRMACVVTNRKKILAITNGFHGRTDVEFIPRDDCDAAAAMIGQDVAAVIVEPVQGVAGAYDLSHEFLTTLRKCTRQDGALFVADEVQSGVGRSGQYFAVQSHGISPDILTTAKALGGGVPCGAVLCTDDIAAHFGSGDLGTTFGGGPLAAAAIVAVIESIEAESLLHNVRQREAQIREQCVKGPVQRIQGKGLLLGLVCDRPAVEVRDALLERDILTGTSGDPSVLRILAPLVLESHHVDHLADALDSIAPPIA
jgi:acetylornithine/succinyldiaminopimelate/putrescine aminotransferase